MRFPFAPLAPLLLPLLLVAGPVRAEEEVASRFERLIGQGEVRRLFDLPPDRFWRLGEPLLIELIAAEPSLYLPALEGAASAFAQATSLEMLVVSAHLPGATEKDIDTNLHIRIGPRGELAQAALAIPVFPPMLAKFEQGHWPFVFDFEREPSFEGQVFIAETEPRSAIEASFVLALVWSLGGATLGPEVDGLVMREDELPMLTSLGQAVLALFVHEDLPSGLPLEEALERAHEIASE